MPANLPPDYYAAEERYRQAKATDEKIRILEEMLSIMPKHKGTDHLLADLRAKISRLKKEETKKKPGARFNPYAVEKEDCPRLTLIGPPNSGKSSLFNALTSASSEVQDYPYTTVKPQPGICRFDNYRIQIVDLPPVMNDSMEGWMSDLVRTADGAGIVVDGSNIESLESTADLLTAVDRANLYLRGPEWKGEAPLGTIIKSTFLAVNKIDIADDEAVRFFQAEFSGLMPVCLISAKDNDSIRRIFKTIVDTLKVMRIYTKIPGKDPDMYEPYIVDRGVSVGQLAEDIHRDFADNFRFARLWGKNTFNARRVGRDHVLEDEDIIEIHC
ncbi:TGS domain-containing protein [bacterium]|nr:TGS domain-containing protein [FCB group bacterium]MBL7190608.1 TGS domain-containing protein [bacterium]